MPQLSHHVLAVIPARGGSTRIPDKNVKHFAGKPLIAHAIEQALQSGIAERVIVDTDSPHIAQIAREHGAEVPFLRPPELATSSSPVTDALLFLLRRLKCEEGYEPEFLLLLQATSPLRERADVRHCFERILSVAASAALTVCPAQPRRDDLVFVDEGSRVCGRVASQGDFALRGCNGGVYVLRVPDFLKEKKIIMTNTTTVLCPAWSSIDIDTSEDWTVAEFLFVHRKEITRQLQKPA